MLNFINFSLKFIIIFFVVIIFFVFSTLWYFSIGLPDYKKLSNYEPPISSRVYSENNNLIIVNNENREKKILLINKLIDVEVNGKPNIYNVDRSIYIKYLI